jgi:hypothetical protein
MLLIAPSWLAPPQRGPDQRRGEDSVLTLRFQDELGASLVLYLRHTDTLPVGLDLVNHTSAGPPEVEVTFADWRSLGGIRLFRSATFTHGVNQFVYTYTDLAVNALPPEAFVPGCSTDRLPDPGEQAPEG